MRHGEFYQKGLDFFLELEKEKCQSCDYSSIDDSEILVTDDDSNMNMMMKEKISDLAVTKRKFKEGINFFDGCVMSDGDSEESVSLGLGLWGRETLVTDRLRVSHFVDDLSHSSANKRGEVRVFETKLEEHSVLRNGVKRQKRTEVRY